MISQPHQSHLQILSYCSLYSGGPNTAPTHLELTLRSSIAALPSTLLPPKAQTTAPLPTAMAATKYAVLSLPLGAFESSDKDDAISSLKHTVSGDNGTTLPFNIPDFKIGTLDALVQQADDLAKLEQNSEAVVAKVADSLRSVLDNDPDRLAQYKMVNDSQSS